MISDETFKKIADETVPDMRKALEDTGLLGLATPTMSMTAEILVDGAWANVRVTVELDPEDEGEKMINIDDLSEEEEEELIAAVEAT